ncbi:MAG: GatB/YqeY domain-containing protein [Candidatus Sericytochromatia bacterium]
MKAQIQADLKEAMKAGKAAERDALRLLLADLMKEEKDKGVDLTDEVAATVINRIIKRTKAAIEEYGNLGQTDTVTKLETELVVYQRYAPEQLSEDAVKAIVDGAVASVNATGPQDMGKVMKAVMPALQGKADGQLISRLVKDALNKH